MARSGVKRPNQGPQVTLCHFPEGFWPSFFPEHVETAESGCWNLETFRREGEGKSFGQANHPNPHEFG